MRLHAIFRYVGLPVAGYILLVSWACAAESGLQRPELTLLLDCAVSAGISDEATKGLTEACTPDHDQAQEIIPCVAKTSGQLTRSNLIVAAAKESLLKCLSDGLET